MIKLEVEAKGKGVNISADIAGRSDKVAMEVHAILQELGDALPREMWLHILSDYLEDVVNDKE